MKISPDMSTLYHVGHAMYSPAFLQLYDSSHAKSTRTIGNDSCDIIGRGWGRGGGGGGGGVV